MRSHRYEPDKIGYEEADRRPLCSSFIKTILAPALTTFIASVHFPNILYWTCPEDHRAQLIPRITGSQDRVHRCWIKWIISHSLKRLEKRMKEDVYENINLHFPLLKFERSGWAVRSQAKRGTTPLTNTRLWNWNSSSNSVSKCSQLLKTPQNVNYSLVIFKKE